MRIWHSSTEERHEGNTDWEEIDIMLTAVDQLIKIREEES